VKTFSKGSIVPNITVSTIDYKPDQKIGRAVFDVPQPVERHQYGEVVPGVYEERDQGLVLRNVNSGSCNRPQGQRLVSFGRLRAAAELDLREPALSLKHDPADERQGKYHDPDGQDDAREDEGAEECPRYEEKMNG
jgi:hypothetical protein